jgi:hypothetical protein
MNRPCLWLCTLTAATAATVADARAFSFHGAGGLRFAHSAAGPELHSPGAAGKSAPPSQYSFSGNSFNLSVTPRNGRPPAAPPPTSAAPNGPARPGFFQRLFNWW